MKKNEKNFLSALIQDNLLKLVNIHSEGNAAAFAKKAGIRQSTFHRYLNDRMPNVESLNAICNTYDVNLNWLLTGRGEMHLEGGGTESINKEGAEGPGAEVIPINNIKVASSAPQGTLEYAIDVIDQLENKSGEKLTSNQKARLIEILTGQGEG